MAGSAPWWFYEPSAETKSSFDFYDRLEIGNKGYALSTNQ